MNKWKDSYQQARLEEVLPDNVVRCHLSPRNCKIKEGGQGFCGVRANRGGRLVTFNYGKSVHATEETIETEAVNHYAPGERILSMGNIGCMLNCDYCHNWKTSQAKYVSDSDVHYYTPEEVVEIALRHGIRVLSWTYNDPVVWHEFVRDTAKLAKQAGLINLYKSAFYITIEAVDELLPYIDIFSISIKSIDAEYYRKITKGTLQPVLDATKHVHRAGKHVEVSTLMVTDISDNEPTARAVTDWVLTSLDDTVPMHFVRFHPDYKMRNGIRTPIPNLIQAREVALNMGAKHVYLGNVYDTPYSNTTCSGCGSLLVSRYGLNATVGNVDAQGKCRQCGTNAHIKFLPQRPVSQQTCDSIAADCEPHVFSWHGDVRSLHVQVKNANSGAAEVYFRRRTSGGLGKYIVVPLRAGESYRFIIAKSLIDETGCEVAVPRGVLTNLHEVFDRAHFPTVSIEGAGTSSTDISPLPVYRSDLIEPKAGAVVAQPRM